MRRFAKPLYGLTPVPRVRIPPSPPDFLESSIQQRDDIKGWFWPDHPAPVGIEADGKNYLDCNTPDIGRGLFQNTYHADFTDACYRRRQLFRKSLEDHPGDDSCATGNSTFDRSKADSAVPIDLGGRRFLDAAIAQIAEERPTGPTV
jgi:hypothetical protein